MNWLGGVNWERFIGTPATKLEFDGIIVYQLAVAISGKRWVGETLPKGFTPFRYESRNKGQEQWFPNPALFCRSEEDFLRILEHWRQHDQDHFEYRDSGLRDVFNLQEPAP